MPVDSVLDKVIERDWHGDDRSMVNGETKTTGDLTRGPTGPVQVALARPADHVYNRSTRQAGG